MKYTSIQLYYLMQNWIYLNLNSENEISTNWIFVFIFLNVLIYCLTLIVFFTLISMTSAVLLKSTDNFKNLSQTIFIYSVLIFIFLTLAGMPPFLSFFSKFFLFILIFKNIQYISICFFFLFNCFTIYFYVQHLKFLTFKKKQTDFLIYFFYKTYSINSLFWIILIIFLLIFGGLFFFDFLALLLIFV